MPFRLTIHGIRIECDTTEELAAALGLKDREPAKHRPAAFPRSAPDTPRGGAARAKGTLSAAPDLTAARAWAPTGNVEHLVPSLPKNEQLAMGLLATTDGEVSLEQLSAAAGFHDRRAGSLMMARWKRLVEGFELPWESFLSFRVVGTRKDRKSLYLAGPLLKEP